MSFVGEYCLVQFRLFNLLLNLTFSYRTISRGGAVNNHPGNRRFRQFIQEFKHQYLNETKQRKPFVAMRVLEAVKNSNPPGRYEYEDFALSYFWLTLHWLIYCTLLLVFLQKGSLWSIQEATWNVVTIVLVRKVRDRPHSSNFAFSPKWLPYSDLHLLNVNWL